MSLTLVDARRPEQAEIPCHLHALTAYRFAVARHDEWIRVDKPGHACDFSVAALREQMRAHPEAVPHGIVNAGREEHLRLGTTFDLWSRNWPGAPLQRPGHGG